MLKTPLGRRIEGWSATGKQELSDDLNELPKLQPEILKAVVDKIAKSYPACNVSEIVAQEAEERSIPEWKTLSDVAAALAFVFGNLDGQPSKDVASDLVSLELLSKEAARIFVELLESVEPLHGIARTVSAYLRVGSPLFVSIRGTVDLRLQFHRTEHEFLAAKQPTGIIEAHRVMLVSLTTTDAEDDDRVFHFLMDENDLTSLKRFIRNMETELELSKSLVKAGSKNK